MFGGGHRGRSENATVSDGERERRRARYYVTCARVLSARRLARRLVKNSRLLAHLRKHSARLHQLHPPSHQVSNPWLLMIPHRWRRPAGFFQTTHSRRYTVKYRRDYEANLPDDDESTDIERCLNGAYFVIIHNKP